VDISPGNYHAIAAVVAFLVALTTRHLFMAIIVGLTCFTLLKLFN
jgi:branched-subunit amino acid transport protein